MVPALLITLREVIEASLIVATILGILVKLNRHQRVKTVWVATLLAFVASLVFLGLASLFGMKLQQWYSGTTEELIEGAFMVVSAAFITWAVFFLHNHFAQYKTRLLKKIKDTVNKQEQMGLFALTFTAVLREGLEIVLFLATIYLSSNPAQIFTGFVSGAFLAFLISFALFRATLKMPVFYAFRVTSILLILFAAGLLAQGVHEFAEAGVLPELPKLTFPFIPPKDSIAGDIIKAIFGVSKKMDAIQLFLYTGYASFMSWWVFLRGKSSLKPV